MSDWRILSNGPSIKKLVELPGEGPVVAVNHAILHETLQADHWCCHEYGRGIENELVHVAQGPLEETWVGQGHISRWAAQHAYRRVHGLPPLFIVPQPHEAANYRRFFAARPHGWPTEAHWGSRSFFAAIGGCILRGATTVRIWGCDMEGDRHFGGGPAGMLARWWSRQHQTGRNKNVRWEWERAAYEVIRAECEQHGVELIREAI